MCHVIREIVGNPFAPWTPAPDFLGGGLVQPDGRTVYLSDTSRNIATAIQADQAFDRLPILADAVEEDGLTGRDLLDHLRHGTGHVRGGLGARRDPRPGLIRSLAGQRLDGDVPERNRVAVPAEPEVTFGPVLTRVRPIRHELGHLRQVRV